MNILDIILLISKFLHAISASIWLGGSIILLFYKDRIIESTKELGLFFKDIVNASIIILLISMAKFHNTTNTGGSQFFIVPSDSNPSHLNGDYTVFGYVTSGLDQIDLISEVATDSNDRPIYDVIIINITIDNLDN